MHSDLQSIGPQGQFAKAPVDISILHLSANCHVNLLSFSLLPSASIWPPKIEQKFRVRRPKAGVLAGLASQGAHLGSILCQKLKRIR